MPSWHNETFTRQADRSIDICVPDDSNAARPALLLFHGGGWRTGDRAILHPHCERFAEAGFVAASAEYRLDGSILDCVLDARAAFEHLAAGAERLGIDRARVAAGGASAGGHLAACLATCPDVATTVAPSALVLFNPLLAFAEGVTAMGKQLSPIGIEPDRISPFDQDLSALPPTIIFHGTNDELISVEQSRRFRDKAVAAGATCDLREYKRRHHGFFIPAEGRNFLVRKRDFPSVTRHAIRFLSD